MRPCDDPPKMRIAITGLGMIAPAAIAPIDRFDTAGLTSHSAAVVRDFKPRAELDAACGRSRRIANAQLPVSVVRA